MDSDLTIRKIQKKYKIHPLGWADVMNSLNSVAYNKRRAADCLWCARVAMVCPQMKNRRAYIAKQLAGASAHRLAAAEVAVIENGGF